EIAALVSGDPIDAAEVVVAVIGRSGDMDGVRSEPGTAQVMMTLRAGIRHVLWIGIFANQKGQPGEPDCCLSACRCQQARVADRIWRAAFVNRSAPSGSPATFEVESRDTLHKGQLFRRRLDWTGQRKRSLPWESWGSCCLHLPACEGAPVGSARRPARP